VVYIRDLPRLGNEVLEEILVPEEALIKTLPERSSRGVLYGCRALDAVADVVVVRKVENYSNVESSVIETETEKTQRKHVITFQRNHGLQHGDIDRIVRNLWRRERVE